MFTGQFYDQFYLIGLLAEFQGWVFGPSLRVRFMTQVYGMSLLIMFMALVYWLTFVSSFWVEFTDQFYDWYFTGRFYKCSKRLISYGSNFVSVLRVVFLVRVYGRLYELIIHVVFMVRVYGIRLRDGFTTQIFGLTLRVRFVGQVFWSSFRAEFTGQAYGSSIFVVFTTLGIFKCFWNTFIKTIFHKRYLKNF